MSSIGALQEPTEEQENTNAVHLSTFTSNLTSREQVLFKLENPSPMGALFIWNSASKLLTQQLFYSSSYLCFILKSLSSGKSKSIVHLTVGVQM